VIDIIESFLSSAIRIAAPLMLATMGEIFAQRSGVINLGIEGIMLMSALGALASASAINNTWLGLIVGIIMGVMFCLLFAYLSISLRCNQIISGLGIYFMGMGLSTFLYMLYTRGMSNLPTAPDIGKPGIPILGDIPIIGPALFQQNVIVYIMYILIPIFFVVLTQTTIGLKITAVGENPRAADSLGINVYKIRYSCVIFSGILIGLAGAYLSTVDVHQFSAGMTAGRGFMVIAIVAFGGWTIHKAFIGTILFGAAYALQLRFQAIGVPIPSQFLLLIPYVLTIIVLVLVSRKIGPASLGVPYEKG